MAKSTKPLIGAEKYVMRMSLNVLNHLGLNLYSNIPAVLSEVVANAYDADARKVTIRLQQNKIVIEDDGHGMTLHDINDKFLMVGYQRRKSGQAVTKKYKREVMGRKGIGKLSLFSIANNIEIHTVRRNDKTKKFEKNGFVLNKYDIENEIVNKSGIYNPKDIPSGKFSISKGTRLILSDFKKDINHTGAYLRKRLARRFSILGKEFKFDIVIDGKKVTIKDRDYFNKIQFLWLIGNEKDEYSKYWTFKKVDKLSGTLEDKSRYKISGWIGTVEYPSDLTQDGVNNNKISIVCRGKMAQEDILESFTEGGIYADYLIGEIHANFLDIDKEEDIATSSRQKINEEDPRYRRLQEHVYKMLKTIQGVWSEYRNELNEKNAVQKANEIHPSLKEWYENLKTDSRKQHAKKLFTTIESFHFDKKDIGYKEKKKELYVQGIVAFEKLKLRDSLHELSMIKSADDIRLARIFTDLTDLEANLYYDIASERVNVIKKFQQKLDDNEKEKLLQNYLFDNLWILNPSWERPTEGSEIMEKRVEKEFNKVTAKLSADERNGRMDIKYRTAAGKHIIIELKRYNPSYSVTPLKLYEQLNKYISALQQCLETTSDKNSPIEAIAIVGKRFNNKEFKQALDLLETINSRFIYYDDLIAESLKSYSDYLDRQKEVSKLRKIIEKLNVS